MLKILHFADAHIDMANYGRHDPQSGLPLRVMDFLKALDTIVDTAINEKVDLVLFAGDAYKDRTPAPIPVGKWERVMRLSRAGIPTLLLVGNHDLSPAMGRAHALENFDTLEVPHVRVIDRPCLLAPDDLEGLPLQVIALPWISRSNLMASLNLEAGDPAEVYDQLGQRLTELVDLWLSEKVDPALPVILAAHCTVQGATYGGERSVMLGNDLVLPGSMVKDPRLVYVALGHIHKYQNLNPRQSPPVIYPGSIERVDFGEAGDEKGFILVAIEHGRADPAWRKLDGRSFIDRYVRLDEKEGITERLRGALGPRADLEGAVVRLVVEYPREWEAIIDEAALREYAAGSFEFFLARRPQTEARIRLPGDVSVGSLTPLELLSQYWSVSHTDARDWDTLQDMAAQVIHEVDG